MSSKNNYGISPPLLRILMRGSFLRILIRGSLVRILIRGSLLLKQFCPMCSNSSVQRLQVIITQRELVSELVSL